MEFILDLYAPIVPGDSLGGLSLDMSESTFLSLLKHELVPYEGFLGERRYVLENGSVVVGVNSKTKKVFRLSAMHGYMGSLYTDLVIGRPISPYFLENSEWYYSEEYGGFLNSNAHGVMVCPDLEDATKEEALQCCIGEISVFQD